MASFDAARVNTPQPQTPQVNAPGVSDTSLAQGIQAFGDIAGEVRKSVLSDRLDQDLRESALITTTLNAPGTVVGPEGVDISASDPSGEINRASDAFQRLSLFREQGKLDVNQVAIEAETLLRKSIAQAPGFANEFRRIAASAVGFDPSGSATRSLFGLGRTTSGGGKTEIQKQTEVAEFLFASGQTDSVEQGFRLQGAIAKNALDTAALDARIAKNAIPAAEAGALKAAEFEAQAFAVLQSRLPQIEETGGIVDVDEAKSEILVKFNLIKTKLLQTTAKQGIVSAQNRTVMLDIIDTSREAMLSIVDTKDLQKILSRQQSILTDQVVIDVASVAPQLVAMSKLGIDVESFFDLVRAAKGDENALKAIKKILPAFGGVVDLIEGTDFDTMSNIIQAITGRTTPSVVDKKGDPVPEPKVVDVTTVATGAAGKKGDTKGYTDGINALLDLRKPIRAISVIANTPNGYSILATDEDKKRIRQVFPTQIRQASTGAAQGLDVTKELVEFDEASQRFIIKDVATGLSRSTAASISSIGGGPAVNLRSGGDQLDFLNNQILPVLQDPSAQADFGISDLGVWAIGIADSINNQASPFLSQPAPTAAPAAPTTNDQSSVTEVRNGIFTDGEGNLFMANGESAGEGPALDAKGRLSARITKQVTVPASVDQSIVTKVTEAADKAGIDPRFMLALMLRESSGNPKAFVERTQAKGLFQAIPANFSDFGPKGGDPFNVDDSIEAAVNFLDQLIDRFNGDIERVVLGWHDGPNRPGSPSPAGLALAQAVKGDLTDG